MGLMPWLVVKFYLENTVEAVPRNWYCEETQACYWPPKTYSNVSIEEKIRNQDSPNHSLWKTYPAVILGQYDNLDIANKKANKAKTTNELSSHNENIEKKCKRKKKRNKKRQTVQNFDTDTLFNNNSKDGNTYSTISILTSSRITSGVTNVISATNSESVAISEDAFSKYQSLNSKYFEEMLKQINLLHLKVNDILDSINIIVKSRRIDTETVNNDRYQSEVLKIIHLFPMNEESLTEVENWINASVDNKAALTEELSRIGGSNLKELIKRIMYRILLNEVGMLYSWEGAKKKKTLKNLNIAAVILDVVRKSFKFQNATELEAINHIKSWLVRSKDRYINSQKKTGQIQFNIQDQDQDLSNIHDLV